MSPHKVPEAVPVFHIDAFGCGAWSVNAAGCQAVGAVSTRAASSRLVGLGEGEFLGI